VKLRVFGILSTTLGTSSIEVEGAPRSVEELLDKLRSAYPDIAVYLEREKVAVAVNHEFVKGDALIRPDDEVALLPPVSGG